MPFDDTEWLNIGSGNGLLPDSTEPIPDRMLTYHQFGPTTLIHEQFHKSFVIHQLLKLVWKSPIKKFHSNLPWVNELICKNSSNRFQTLSLNIFSDVHNICFMT